MGSRRLRKSIPLRRRLNILLGLNTSKSHVKSNSVVMVDALLYIYILKLKLEAIRKEYSNLLAMKKQYLNLLNHISIPNDVKVEKTEEGYLGVRVRCEKQEDTLVSVLQVFEEMSLHVLQARVSCCDDKSFSMEALLTTVAQNHNNQAELSARDVEEAITKAIEKRQLNHHQNDMIIN